MRPLSDRIVIRPEPAETTTASGIIIPDTAKETPLRGVVLAVGKGKVADNGRLIPMEVTEGDLILHVKYAGTEVTHEGEDLLIITQRDVIAVL